MTHIHDAIHAVIAAVVLWLTPAGEAYSYTKPAPAPQVELIPATSGAVPR